MPKLHAKPPTCTAVLGACLLLASACGGSASPQGEDEGSSAGDDASDTEAGTSTAGGGPGGSEAAASDDGIDDGGSDSTGGAMVPQPTMLPTPTGVCPTMVDGDVEFAPAGIAPRTVRLWISDAAQDQAGPLVLYWHGTGSQPLEATYGLGNAYVEQVVAQGGIVAAPTHDPAAGQFPWFLVLGSQEDDLILADEIVACAIEQTAVDVSRIHTIGMSAGGLQSAQMSWRRSGYIASAVTYSGGFVGSAPADQDPSNPLAAMIFHGGESDVVIISFQQASENYLAALTQAGRFGFVCDHGMGHSIPQGDAQASVWTFFRDHPWGTKPSPYASGLPDGFPEYCAL